MAYELSNLKPNKGARKEPRRLGIGEGSGLGKTSGKGHKGHKARSGYKSKPGFEGGQMPLYRRLPKFGFTSRKKTLGKNVFSLVAVDRLEELGAKEITPELLLEKGFVGKYPEKVKILGLSRDIEGNPAAFSAKLKVTAHAFSKSAREAIEKAGGEAIVIE
jgi:large subunit ribosomal protein L15